MSIQFLYHFFEVVGIVSCALIFVAALRDNPKNLSSQLLALLAICAICYLLRTRQEYSYFIPELMQLPNGFLDIPMDLLMNAFSGVFMMFAHSLFREDKPFPRWLLAVFGFQMALEPVSLVWPREILLQLDEVLGVTFAEVTFFSLPRALQLFLVGFALFWTIRDWQTDLVERRRKIRLIVLAYVAVTNLIVGLAYSFVVPQVGYFAFQIHVLTVSLVSMTPFLLVAFNVHLNLEVEDLSPASGESSDQETVEALKDFLHEFENDQVYLKPGLSVRTLAAQFAMPEYRLRRIIHEGLGFRNFNAFLHHYRIEDACRVLEDPAQRNVPILTIALSVGYQSINPFNRAFRELKGITPTEYRKRTTTTGKTLTDS